MRLSLSPFTSKVAFAAKRTSTRRQNRLDRSKMTLSSHCARLIRGNGMRFHRSPRLDVCLANDPAILVICFTKVGGKIGAAIAHFK
jgi:hypothetical protein